MKGSLKTTSAVIVGIILSIPLGIFGFFAYQNVTTRASDAQPRDVIISQITSTSALITWTTDQETQGVVEYGTAPTALVFFAPEAQRVRRHEVELTLLSPNTTHYFQIRVGDEIFDNGGVPWTFTTKSSDEAVDSITPTDEENPANQTTPSAATPSPVLTLPAQTPVPTQPSQATPTSSPVTPTPVSCEEETDCQKVLQRLNKGCTSADYVRCIKRSAPTPTFTPVPTAPDATPTTEPDDITPSLTPSPTP